MNVFYLEAEHGTMPVIWRHIFADRASADAKAAEAVNMLVDYVRETYDFATGPTATPETWEEVLQREIYDRAEDGAEQERDDYLSDDWQAAFVTVLELELEGSPEPGPVKRLLASTAALLNVSELNMDDMEPETVEAMDEAEAAIAEATAAQPAPAPIAVGLRVLSLGVDRFPNFAVAVGKLGTVVRVKPDEIAVLLDDKIDGAEDWENCVEVTLSHATEYAKDLEAIFWSEFERTENAEPATPPPRTPDDAVWVLVIDTDMGGTTSEAYRTEEGARGALADYCRMFWQDIKDERDPAKLSDAEVTASYWDWQSMHGVGWHTLERCELND